MTPDDPRAMPLHAPPDSDMTDRGPDRSSQDAPMVGVAAHEIAVSTDRRPVPQEITAPSIRLKDLNAWYGDTHAIKGVSLDYAPNQVTARIGPSG